MIVGAVFTNRTKLEDPLAGTDESRFHLVNLRGELYPVQTRHVFLAEHLAVPHFVHCHVRDTMCPAELVLGHFRDRLVGHFCAGPKSAFGTDVHLELHGSR
jgi:hypothetical protein